MKNKATIYVGDVFAGIQNIEDKSVQSCITSPPYWGLRNYGHDDQLGLESTPEQYVNNMVDVFREVWRILADDGVLWLNLGDTYNGNKVIKTSDGDIKPKDLVGIPWRVAFALQQDGWYLRQDIIWHKPNPMPESITDRCTKAHEYLFLLTKSSKYFFDNNAICEESITTWNAAEAWKNRQNMTSAEIAMGADLEKQRTRGFGTHHSDVERNTRNKRSVWSIPVKPFKGSHFAVMPEALVVPCVLATTKCNDLIFDPFTGSGTVGAVAVQHERNFVGTELNPLYANLALKRIEDANLLFSEVELVQND